jgi:hypothetical protein
LLKGAKLLDGELSTPRKILVAHLQATLRFANDVFE